MEKNAKIEDFGLPKPSQNPPKILSKSRFQKTCDFSSILARILMLVARANIKKTCAHAVFCSFFTLRSLFLFACISDPKNRPKTLPKQGPNPSKIHAENVLLSNIDFFKFWTQFWRILGLQVRRAACSARRVKAYRILYWH